LLPQITPNLPNIPTQHGFKPKHSTNSALHVINSVVATGFNHKKPPERTIAVTFDMSKAFDTVNLHLLIQKLLPTTVPNTVKRFIANYIRGRIAYTFYNNHTSRKANQNRSTSSRRTLSDYIQLIHL